MIKIVGVRFKGDAQEISVRFSVNDCFFITGSFRTDDGDKNLALIISKSSVDDTNKLGFLSFNHVAIHDDENEDNHQ